MQINSVLATIVEEAKAMSFEEIKNLYPDEWVVVEIRLKLKHNSK